MSMQTILIDHEALSRALKQAKRDPVKARQLEAIEKQDGWRRAGEQAAYSLQCDRLLLKPWQSPPCYGDVDPPVDDFVGAGRAAAADLLRRLLEAGLSRREPDPLKALERVERECAGAKSPPVA
jgi:hypothetical protein